MAAHIFTVSEENYKICIDRGLVAIPEAKEGSRHDNVMDGLLSRLYAIKENDYVLMYNIGSKKLKGVWQVEGVPFYDESPVWQDRIYPFRCKIRCSEYNFTNSLDLDDINDLRNAGRIWTWALQKDALFTCARWLLLVILLKLQSGDMNFLSARMMRKI